MLLITLFEEICNHSIKPLKFKMCTSICIFIYLLNFALAMNISGNPVVKGKALCSSGVPVSMSGMILMSSSDQHNVFSCFLSLKLPHQNI